MSATHLKAHGWRDMGKHQLISGQSAQLFLKGGCKVLVSQEPRRHDDQLLWHLSISRDDRYPGWEEIKDARYSLLPLGLTFAMILPPPNEYVNIHNNCFHLWEIEDQNT